MGHLRPGQLIVHNGGRFFDSIGLWTEPNFKSLRSGWLNRNTALIVSVATYDDVGTGLIWYQVITGTLTAFIFASDVRKNNYIRVIG